MRHYLLIVEGDTQPQIRGPFASELRRDNAAIRHKAQHGDDDGIFWLDMGADGKPRAGAYTGGFLAGQW